MIPRGAMAAAGRARRAMVALQRRRAPAAAPYAEDYYLALDQPSQYLRTLAGELAGYDSAVLTLALKVRSAPTDASAIGPGIICTLNGSSTLPGQAIYATGGPPPGPAIYRGWTDASGLAYIASPGVATTAGVRVYSLTVDWGVGATYSYAESLAGAASASGGPTSYTPTLREAVDLIVGRFPTSSATVSMDVVWVMAATVPVTIAHAQSWSAGVVDPRVTLGAGNVPFFWRADSFDGAACPNEGNGGVAPLSGVNCTIADKVAA